METRGGGPNTLSPPPWPPHLGLGERGDLGRAQMAPPQCENTF